MKKKYRFYWEENKAPEKGINIELPGFSKDEIKVTIENGFATINAAKKEHSVKRGRNFYSEEAFSQSLNRSFSLPEDIKPDEISIEIKDGAVEIKKKKKKII